MAHVSDLDIENKGALKARRIDLENKLRELDAHLRDELRARGFDPDQDDNLALTAPLAKLYTDRENLRLELAALTESKVE